MFLLSSNHKEIFLPAFTVSLLDADEIDVLSLAVTLDEGLDLLQRETFHIVATTLEDSIVLENEPVLEQVRCIFQLVLRQFGQCFFIWNGYPAKPVS